MMSFQRYRLPFLAAVLSFASFALARSRFHFEDPLEKGCGSKKVRVPGYNID